MELEFDSSTGPPARCVTVVLMGLRGSGKTTVGKRLSGRLGLPFVDLDVRTARFAGEPSVAEAFARRGERAFREAEARALEAALKEPACVLALGGGTPTAPGAAEMLRRAREEDCVCVVYLRADAGTLRARLAGADNSHRPSLTGRGVLEEIEEVSERRDRLYRELASFVVEVAGSDVERVAGFVAAKLG